MITLCLLGKLSTVIIVKRMKGKFHQDGDVIKSRFINLLIIKQFPSNHSQEEEEE